ncbi:MAG: nicotinate-nucleotide adenylyltransferase [Anaerovoracaceae bacterium]|jgi:nicotinate-nucleotide adenylyltransferase
MKRIGVIGGTFDPVHRGHISLAEDALEQAHLTRVYFMPAAQQPFKLGQRVTPVEVRIAMLEAALAGRRGLAVSRLEVELGGISYTCRTLSALRQRRPGCELYFITGTDTYLKLHLWKDADRLLRENAFIVGERPGCRGTELRAKMKEYQKKYGTRTLLIDNDRLDISSTEIRDRVAAGQPIGDLVPEGAERYIHEHGLYAPIRA